MTTDRSHLVPKVIPRKDGVVTTVWVNPEDPRVGHDLAATKAVVEATGRNGSWGGGKGLPAELSWGSMSPAALMEATAATCRDLENPKDLWSNIDRLTQAAESRYGTIPYQVMEVENALVRLRDTWLKMHGTDVHHPEVYTAIGGDEGYESFRTAFDGLQDVFYATREKALANGEHVVSGGRRGSGAGDDLSVVEEFEPGSQAERDALWKLDEDAFWKQEDEASTPPAEAKHSWNPFRRRG